MALEHQHLTHEILGAAIDVHRSLGPGFLEVIYAKALEVELAARRIHFERELSVPVFYRGVEVGRHRIDLLVARTIELRRAHRHRKTGELPSTKSSPSWVPGFLSGILPDASTQCVRRIEKR